MTSQIRYPTSDSYGTAGWSRSPASGGYYDHVDEASPDDGDYIQCTFTGGYYLFGFTAFSVPVGSTNIALTIHFRALKTSSGPSNVAAATSIGFTDRLFAGRDPTTSFADYSDTYLTNPDTGAAWTVDEINGVAPHQFWSFGVGANDALPSVQFSQVYAEVTYDPPSAGKRVNRPMMGLLS